MKRKRIDFEQQNEEHKSFVSTKKQKVMELTKAQQIMADINLPKYLDEGKTDLVKAALELAFSTPKKVETLLAYTNYQMFWWAIEHQDIELMRYVLDKTTERGKFLIVCHNNYALLKKFVDLGIQKIQDDTYQAFPAVKILEVLVNANPSTSYLIIDSVKSFIDGKNLDAPKVANILKEDFQTISPNFMKKNDNYKINETPNAMISSCDAGLEQELAGDLPHS
jgi:hypothetical protein